MLRTIAHTEGSQLACLSTVYRLFRVYVIALLMQPEVISY
jgi:hypothetical protein